MGKLGSAEMCEVTSRLQDSTSAREDFPMCLLGRGVCEYMRRKWSGGGETTEVLYPKRKKKLILGMHELAENCCRNLSQKGICMASLNGPTKIMST